MNPNNPVPPGPTTKTVKDPKTGVETTVTIPSKPTPPNIWPVKTVYPNAGAILPFNRIIAYYGNLYSTKMGVLGEYKEEEMLARLDAEVKNGMLPTRILQSYRLCTISRWWRKVALEPMVE